MKAKDFSIEVTLSSENIDRISDRLSEYLAKIEKEKREIIRIRLSVEDILVKLRNRFGESERVKFSCHSIFGQPTVQLKIPGEQFDPIASEDEFGGFNRKLFSGLQSTPMYSYSANTNIITYKLKKKRLSPIFLLAAAVLLGAIISAVGFFTPEVFRTAVTENILTPICNTYLDVLNFFCIPLIFLSIAIGICGIGDASSFGKIGKTMILNFTVTLLLSSVFTALVAYPFFNFAHGASGLSVEYSDFLKMILDFLPTSLVKPFLDCNAMQLIILGIIFGIAMLKLRPITKTLLDVLDDVNSVLLLVSEWFTRIIPLFVVIMIVNGVWTGELDQILSAWKSWVITTGIELVITIAFALPICMKHKVSLMTLVRKTTATFLIAFGTNSCSAAVSEVYDCCDKLGVSPSITGVGIPVGTSAFKPITAVRLIVLVYFMASFYNVGVSPAWFVMTVFMSVLLSIAIPAIPGGTLMFCPMLFAQLGIPVEALTAMLATDIFFDSVCTALNQIVAELALTRQAGKLSLIDCNQLKK